MCELLTRAPTLRFSRRRARVLPTTTTTSSAVTAGFPNRTLEFKYDYLGRRVQKRSENLSAIPNTDVYRRYLYDGDNLVAEFDATATTCGNLVRSYTWGLDLAGSLAATGGVGALIQITDHNPGGSAASYFPTFDGNGNVASLLNAADGTVAAAYEYSPFGELLRCAGSYAMSNPFRFSTKFTDDESGLVYYGARYYSPGLGRFINRDPIEEGGGLNLYGFCGNDGVNGFDVLGNSWLSKLWHSASRLWDRTGLSLSKHIAQNWDHGRTYVIDAVAIVAAIVTYGAASEWAFGELTYSLALAESGSAAYADMAVAMASVTGVSGAAGTAIGIGAAAIGGAAAGFVGGAMSTALNGGNLGQVVSSGFRGAAAGAVMGGVEGYYGTSYPLARIGATATAGGVSNTLIGGSFKRGFELGAIQGTMAYGWDQMRQLTDRVGQNTATNYQTDDIEQYGTNRFHYDGLGYLRTDGPIATEYASSLFGSAADKFFAPFDNLLNANVMGPQGIPGSHWYDAAWLGGPNNAVSGFVNLVSKAHDFVNSWSYHVDAGAYINRGDTADTLFQISSVSMMPVAGVFTAVALSPATVNVLGHHP